MQEIFLLGYHMHWSPESCLALPVADRQALLRLLAEQLERERAANGGDT